MKAFLLGGVVVALSVLHMGHAETLEPAERPKGPVILKVDGKIAHANVAQEAHFDRAMLYALPQYAFETDTPWTDGSSHYSGPLMRTVLAHVGYAGDRVHVAALNGYEAEIPISDFYDYDVILALERNQKQIPIREYGPLWVLYPFSQDEALLSEKMRFRAVWQVMQINVR